MKILISNDDGVHAPGIRSLFQYLTTEHETIMIAPQEERSTTGHSLSLDKPLRLKNLEKNIYACDGFPADCVLMGIGHLLKDAKPDLVVSGINRGANLAQDLYYSGTVAAAREAAFHKFPSIAVSLAFDHVNEYHYYETASQVILKLIKSGIKDLIQPYTLINVNVPNLAYQELKGISLTTIGFRNYSEEIHHRKDSRDRDYYWVAGLYKGFKQDPQSDNWAISEGKVSITLHNLLGDAKIDSAPLKKFVEGMTL